MKIKRKQIYNIKIAILCIFIFSLPFEYWDPFGVREVFTVTKSAGLLYFLFSVFDWKINFRLGSVKRPVFALLLLWILMLIQSSFNHQHGVQVSVFSFSFLQNIILFWLISNDVVRNRKVIGKIFLSLIISVFTMGLLASFGIGLDSAIDAELGTYRLRFFGSNPNTVGNLASVALLFIFAILIDSNKYYKKKSFLLIILIPSILMLLSASGSRGALLIAFIGIVSLFIFQKKSIGKKLFLIVIGSGFMSYAIYVIMQSSIVQRRLESSNDGDGFGGRTPIWDSVLNIFYDKPLLGRGLTGYHYEMIKAHGVYMDPHNIFLYVMVTTGIVGLILYLSFIYLLFNASLLYYRKAKDILPFALLMVFLFSVVKSGGAINDKLYWILAAMIFGLGEQLRYKLLKKY